MENNIQQQLTDAIKMLVEMGRKVIFKEIELHIDVGTIEDWKRANGFVKND